MRRNAGSFIRGKMVKSGLLLMLASSILIGLAIGFLIYTVFPRWIGYGWGYAAYVVALAMVYVAIRVFDRPSLRWNLENLKKGEDAETRVGQIIEYAITAENCAVAHSVTEIAKVGDIDHIVATPEALWVIETKYRKVPRRSFPEVLSRIAANTAAVRQWAPAGTPVRACLVLAYETSLQQRHYSHNGERITAYTPKLLMREMRERRTPARASRQLDARIMKAIWKLGGIAE